MRNHQVADKNKPALSKIEGKKSSLWPILGLGAAVLTFGFFAYNKLKSRNNLDYWNSTQGKAMKQNWMS